jgi:hypothetical protein
MQSDQDVQVCGILKNLNSLCMTLSLLYFFFGIWAIFSFLLSLFSVFHFFFSLIFLMLLSMYLFFLLFA